MIRLFLFFLGVAVIAAGAAWLADRPGEVVLNWQGWRVETSITVLVAAVILLVIVLMVVWTLLRVIFGGPAALSSFFRSRRREKGLNALSRGMIAAAAGDRRGARRHAGQARKLMRGEPLALLLEAQAAQLAGDRKAARQAFEAMLADNETELLGLRGLHIEAERAGDETAARIHAQRANDKAPGLPWAANAVLQFHTKEGDWQNALRTVERNAASGVVDSKDAKRERAVLLTAQAMEREESDHDKAMELSLEAHRLAPELVPAAAIAGRLAAANSDTRQATRILEKTWRLSPHPQIAEIYAHARPGDSARDRLKRARRLAAKLPNEPEGRLAVAVAAIDAHDWTAAREALQPLLGTSQPRRKVCLLMAEIEEGERGDAGRVREWLARALRAPRDPAWVADGYVSERWAPVSPITGKLDAFEWTTPPEAISVEQDRSRIPDAPRDDLVIEGASVGPSKFPDPPEAEASPTEHESAPNETDDRGHREEVTPRKTAAFVAPEPSVPPSQGTPDQEVVFPRPPDDPGPEPEREPQEGPRS